MSENPTLALYSKELCSPFILCILLRNAMIITRDCVQSKPSISLPSSLLPSLLAQVQVGTIRWMLNGCIRINHHHLS